MSHKHPEIYASVKLPSSTASRGALQNWPRTLGRLSASLLRLTYRTRLPKQRAVRLARKRAMAALLFAAAASLLCCCCAAAACHFHKSDFRK